MFFVCNFFFCFSVLFIYFLINLFIAIYLMLPHSLKFSLPSLQIFSSLLFISRSRDNYFVNKFFYFFLFFWSLLFVINHLVNNLLNVFFSCIIRMTWLRFYDGWNIYIGSFLFRYWLVISPWISQLIFNDRVPFIRIVILWFGKGDRLVFEAIRI